MKIFDKFIDTKQKAEPREKILPFDARYAISYKDGIFNTADIESLLDNNFANEALYLTFKSLVGSPTEHKALLEKYISHILENRNNEKNQKDTLREIVISQLENKKNVTVDGRKLAQMSRQSFDFWKEKFETIALELSNDRKEVFLLAHSMFVGLDSFIKDFSEKNKTLNILVPDWLKNENIGYMITFNNRKANIKWLHAPFNKQNSILVDDTKKTGDTLVKVKNYLEKNGSGEAEMLTMDNASKA